MNPKSEPVVMTALADSSSSWDGEVLPAYPAGTPKVSIRRVTIPPQARLAMHTHPVINAGIVLQGELTVVSERGDVRVFRTGDTIVELVGTAHYGENRGDEAVDLVMFYAGAEGLPLSEPVTQ